MDFLIALLIVVGLFIWAIIVQYDEENFKKGKKT